jgi:signal transduction histidine kinase
MLDINVLKKYKVGLILLAAMLTTIVLMLLGRLPFFLKNEDDIIVIEEKNGIYDLSQLVDWGEGAVTLPPSSTYYPNVLLPPGSTESELGVSTDEYDKINADYLSQRFVVELPDNNKIYTLTFQLSGRHGMWVFVNGELVGTAGKPGTTKEETEVFENNLTCYASPKDGEMDIILQSSQFYHNRYGARLATLNITNTAVTNQKGLTDQAKGYLMMGAFLCAALLLLCIYVLQTHNRATLYFTLACVDMTLREGIQSQAWTDFTFLSGNVSFMLEYLSLVLLTILFSFYLGQYAISRFLRGIQYTAIISSIIYGLIVLFGDSVFYTSVLKYYQIVLVLCIVPGITVLIWNMRHPNKEQSAAIYGIAVFYIAAVSDILMYNSLLPFIHKKIPISEAAMLIFVVAQTMSLFLMNNRLLTESKNAEQRLVVEKESLKKLNQMKTEFLGNVSHELKTPLTVMSGYAQTTKELAEGEAPLDTREVSRRMKLISSEAQRLSLMVGQVLDVTRMEEGRMEIRKIDCHIDEIIHKAIETHYPMLNKNANRLEIHIETCLPRINADPARISQVIVNLISNAVRFTANGLITISATREEDKVKVCVSDTGAGISESFLKHVFERYNTKGKKGGGQDTGTGLGLYICKHIIEEHGGSIWIESEEGRGTNVFFTLPSQSINNILC